jgi:hypothetical protein
MQDVFADLTRRDSHDNHANQSTHCNHSTAWGFPTHSHPLAETQVGVDFHVKCLSLLSDLKKIGLF